MKKIHATLVGIWLFASASVMSSYAVVIVTYPFGTVPVGSASFVHPTFLSAADVVRVGADISGNEGNGGFASDPVAITSGWPSVPNTIFLDSYWQIQVDVAPGFELTNLSFNFNEQPNAQGPDRFVIRWNQDNFGANLAVQNTDAFAPLEMITLPAQAVTGSLEIRVYGIEAQNANGLWYIDNIELQGDGGASTAIPEPSSLGLIGLGMVCLSLFRMRRERALAGGAEDRPTG